MQENAISQALILTQQRGSNGINPHDCQKIPQFLFTRHCHMLRRHALDGTNGGGSATWHTKRFASRWSMALRIHCHALAGVPNHTGRQYGAKHVLQSRPTGAMGQQQHLAIPSRQRRRAIADTHCRKRRTLRDWSSSYRAYPTFSNYKAQ